MNNIIAWWSGGVTSAVACKLIINKYGKDNVRVIFINTRNEDPDTYRFMFDCEMWYGVTIEALQNDNYTKIEDVWRKFKSLNVASGAICSSELKRAVRLEFQRNNKFDHQVFGFDISEIKRATNLSKNYPETNPLFPLIEHNLSKKDCIELLEKNGISVPNMYYLGFQNNNCWRTGCIQGGAGYWQKIQREYPDKFNYMADIEHELTNAKGKPVTVLRKKVDGEYMNVFFKPHPDYPNNPIIDSMHGREPKVLVECNGFCGTDVEPNPDIELALDEYEFDITITKG